MPAAQSVWMHLVCRALRSPSQLSLFPTGNQPAVLCDNLQCRCRAFQSFSTSCRFQWRAVVLSLPHAFLLPCPSPVELCSIACFSRALRSQEPSRLPLAPPPLFPPHPALLTTTRVITASPPPESSDSITMLFWKCIDTNSKRATSVRAIIVSRNNIIRTPPCIWRPL
jgi:hypothetical protein